MSLGKLGVWSGAMVLVCLVCVTPRAAAAEAEQGSAAATASESTSSGTRIPGIPWLHRQFGGDLYFEDHGPEGTFQGWGLSGALGYRWSRTFLGVRAAFYGGFAPYETKISGVGLQIDNSGARVGFDAGHRIWSRLWLVGELAPQYDYVSTIADDASSTLGARPIRARPVLNEGWGLRASLGVSYDVLGFAFVRLSATLALPFQRNHYDVDDTTTPSGRRRLYTASVLRPGVSLTLGY